MSLKDLRVRNWKFYLRFFIAFQLAVSSVPTFSTPSPSNLTHDQLDEIDNFLQKKGRRAVLKSPYIGDIDPHHLLNQHVSFMGRNGFKIASKDYLYVANKNSFDEIIDEVKFLNVSDVEEGFNIEGSFDGTPLVRQRINIDGKVLDFVEDIQFGVILSDQGELFIFDKNFAIRAIGHAPIPIARIPLTPLAKRHLKNINERTDIKVHFVSSGSVSLYNRVFKEVKDQLESKSENSEIFLRNGDLFVTKNGKIVFYVEREEIISAILESYNYVYLTLVLSDVMGSYLKDSQRVSEKFKNLTLKDEKIFSIIAQILGGAIPNLNKLSLYVVDSLNHLKKTSVPNPSFHRLGEDPEKESKGQSADKKLWTQFLIKQTKTWGYLGVLALVGTIFLGIPDTVVGTNAFGTYFYTYITLGALFVAVPLGISYLYKATLNLLSKLTKGTKIGKRSSLQRIAIEKAIERSKKEGEGYLVRRWVVLFPLMQKIAAYASFPFWEYLVSFYYRVLETPYVNLFKKGGHSEKKIESAIKEIESTLGRSVSKSFFNKPELNEQIQQSLDRNRQQASELENRINNLIFLIIENPEISQRSLSSKKMRIEDFKRIMYKMEKNPDFKKKIMWVKNELGFNIDELVLLLKGKSKTQITSEISKIIRKALKEYVELETDKKRLEAFLEKIPKEIKSRMDMYIKHYQEEHSYLKSNTTLFHARRGGIEYTTDQFTLVLLTAFISQRSNYAGFFNSDILQLYSHSFWGTSPQGFADALNNAFLHLFFASMTLALSLRPEEIKFSSILKNVSETYSSQIGSEKKEGFWEHVRHRLSYLKKWGVDNNLGEMVKKREKAMYFSAWQSVFLFFAIPRWWSGELTLTQSVVSFIIFSFYSLPVYRWFWGWVSGSAAYIKEWMEINKKTVDEILNSLERIRTRAWVQTQEDLKKNSETIVLDVEKIFGKNKAEEVSNELKRVLNLKDQNAVDKVLDSLKTDIGSKAPSSRVNDTADFVTTTLIGPVITTVLAIPLLIWTFNPSFLTSANFMVSLAVYTGTLLGFTLFQRPLLKDIAKENGEIVQSWKGRVKGLVSKSIIRVRNLEFKSIVVGVRNVEFKSTVVGVLKLVLKSIVGVLKIIVGVLKVVLKFMFGVLKLLLKSMFGVLKLVLKPIVGVLKLAFKPIVGFLKLAFKSIGRVRNLTSQAKLSFLSSSLLKEVSNKLKRVSNKLDKISEKNKSKVTSKTAKKEMATKKTVKPRSNRNVKLPNLNKQGGYISLFAKKSKKETATKETVGIRDRVKGLFSKPIIGVKGLVSKKSEVTSNELDKISEKSKGKVTSTTAKKKVATKKTTVANPKKQVRAIKKDASNSNKHRPNTEKKTVKRRSNRNGKLPPENPKNQGGFINLFAKKSPDTPRSHTPKTPPVQEMLDLENPLPKSSSKKNSNSTQNSAKSCQSVFRGK